MEPKPKINYLPTRLLLFPSFDAGYTQLYRLSFHNIKDVQKILCQQIQEIPSIAKSVSVACSSQLISLM